MNSFCVSKRILLFGFFFSFVFLVFLFLWDSWWLSAFLGGGRVRVKDVPDKGAFVFPGSLALIKLLSLKNVTFHLIRMNSVGQPTFLLEPHSRA